ncbi:MAG: putative lipid II flippase FtsW [Clostridia bacterium]|nr:putative lipid II flippase FtsW [Oscillospiraceae bacterium]MBP3600643.1 putative lipid II flippase FtsW [Clostridia bacterium]
MDVVFLSLVLILLTFGLVMLFSASYAFSLEYYDNSYKFISRQALFGVAGVVIMLIVSRIDYHFWRKFAWVIYAISIIMLIMLLIFPPMLEGMDVKRWIVIGSFNFQPSEVAKFAIILLFSSLIAANYKQMKSLGFVGFLILLLGATCGLIVAEPHLSATVLVFCIGVVLLIVGGLAKKYIFGGIIAVAVGAVVFAFSGAISYVSDRLQYWIDPWSDATGKGFQTIQSLLAIGSGGILGRGIGQSRQKYLYLPEPHNDFIFSIVCEELGLIGAMVVIILFCLLVWRGFSIAMHSSDKFGSLLAIGLTFQVGLQAMLNIWVVTNTIPNTGISLPFFSYGGTSLVILLAEMGIVLSVSRGANIEKT